MKRVELFRSKFYFLGKKSSEGKNKKSKEVFCQ